MTSPEINDLVTVFWQMSSEYNQEKLLLKRFLVLICKYNASCLKNIHVLGLPVGHWYL